MSDIAAEPGSIEPRKATGPKLDHGFHPATGVMFLGEVAAAALFVDYSIRRQGHDVPALHPAFRRLVDRLGVRVRQRLPRHGKCSRDRHLHTLAAGEYRGGAVRQWRRS